jgi:hypothetical protein
MLNILSVIYISYLQYKGAQATKYLLRLNLHDLKYPKYFLIAIQKWEDAQKFGDTIRRWGNIHMIMPTVPGRAARQLII